MEKSNKKVAYITGGTKGIGKGVALALLQNNYRVALSGRNYEVVKEVADLLGKTEDVLALQSDVRNFEDEQKAVNKVVEHFGQLDVVIANAGIGIFDSVENLSIEDWHTMIDTNLTGVFLYFKSKYFGIKNHKRIFYQYCQFSRSKLFCHSIGL